jgi:alpha-galactosidase
VIEGTSFALNGRNVTYSFHVDEATGDLISDHFGGKLSGVPATPPPGRYGGWSKIAQNKREFPDQGRGDFRSPAVRIRHNDGHTVSQFQYQAHTVLQGKPKLDGLPSTFGDDGQAETLVIHLYDSHSSVAADLSYTIFPEYDAIVRSVKITNKGPQDIVIEKLSSLSIDLPHAEYDMLGLRGEWGRECTKLRRRIDFGTQG